MDKERIIVLDTNRSHYDVKEAADDSMTVEELIEELRYLPGDCKVVFRNDNGYTYGYISDRGIDSEYYEPEPEDDEDYVTAEDMVNEIRAKVYNNANNPVEISAVWVDNDDRKVLSVGYIDQGNQTLGVFLDNNSTLPLSELTEDDLDAVWYAATIR